MKQTAGFVLFTLVLEAMWMLLRVDVLEDLNLFADVRYWPWFAGAVFLHALLTAVAVRIRRPFVRNGWVFGLLAVAFAIGLLMPLMIGGDGLAVGMLQFLTGYWVLSVATYRVIWIIGSGMNRRAKKTKK